MRVALPGTSTPIGFPCGHVMTSSDPTSEAVRLEGDPRADHVARRDPPHRSPMPLLDHGLGHELRNLVMPILLRIDALTASEKLSEKALEDLAGIRRNVSHIQRLADGLRLISSDPLALDAEWQITQLPEWWADVRALVNDTLPPHAFVTAQFPEHLPSVAIPPAVLAQGVIHLLVDARTALHHVLRPTVTLRAITRGDVLDLTVEDNRDDRDVAEHDGPTADPISQSTHSCAFNGAQCAAHSLLRRYGAELLSVSSTDRRHAVTLRIPLATRTNSVGSSANTLRVAIQLADPRHAAVARVVIARRGLRESSPDEAELPDVVLCDAKMYCDVLLQDELLEHTARGARLLVIGDPHGEPVRPQVRWIDPRELARLAEFL